MGFQVREATGFGEGLYNEEERNSENMKEKPQKIQFLEKIINCVGIHLGVHCPVMPSCRRTRVTFGHRSSIGNAAPVHV